ncbi:MAG: cell division protein ZapA [Spirochaetia bacterium]|nr:cell division protein ZapA [Spirochaetia bacterium]
MGYQTKVNILNREYVLTGDLDSEYIKELAEKIDERLLQIKKNLSKKPDDVHLLILLAMNLMDEIELCRGKSLQPSEDEISRKANRLISMLEKGLVG